MISSAVQYVCSCISIFLHQRQRTSQAQILMWKSMILTDLLWQKKPLSS